ncbi:MAG: hypothetical protein AAF982_12600, partial [Pseudomonadota bacterium]
MRLLSLRCNAAAVLPLIFPIFCPAQGWENPAERYLDAHEAYSDALCPIAAGDIRHFVYFARDRTALRTHALLTSDRFAGAQIMYSWRELEPREDVYDFAAIRADVAYLARFGKRLFIQLQDATFSPRHKPVPEYLLSETYDGGATEQYFDDGAVEGWVSKRWSPAVQTRFAA